MESQYRDRWIECSPDGIQIRGYYFPWGQSAFPRLDPLAAARRASTFTARWRIWGTSNPRYWASLDPHEGASRSAHPRPRPLRAARS